MLEKESKSAYTEAESLCKKPKPKNRVELAIGTEMESLDVLKSRLFQLRKTH
jgi:hypothetical protein